MNLRTFLGAISASVLVLVPHVARGESLGILTLDGLSFIAFEGEQNVALPSGSSVRFRFENPSENSAAFTISPSDVTIPPIPMAGGATLTYALSSPATGMMRRVAGALEIDFEASITASVSSEQGQGSATYALRFTTRQATATSVDGKDSVAVEGMPVVPGPRYVQIVGGATNRPDALPAPGAAVYAVLSGSFNSLPDLP